MEKSMSFALHLNDDDLNVRSFLLLQFRANA